MTGRLTLVFVLFAVLQSSCSSNKDFTYSVDAKNGSATGFNDITQSCADGMGEFKATASYSGAGNEKYQTMCEDAIPAKAESLIKQCEALIASNADTTGTLENGGFRAEFDVINSYNFSFKVTNVK